MHADPGDWLVVKGVRESQAPRRAEILSVGTGGIPPYGVRWLDTGHEGLVFPGPDGAVITATRQAELDRAQVERAVRIQSEIRADRQ